VEAGADLVDNAFELAGVLVPLVDTGFAAVGAGRTLDGEVEVDLAGVEAPDAAAAAARRAAPADEGGAGARTGVRALARDAAVAPDGVLAPAGVVVPDALEPVGVLARAGAVSGLSVDTLDTGGRREREGVAAPEEAVDWPVCCGLSGARAEERGAEVEAGGERAKGVLALAAVVVAAGFPPRVAGNVGLRVGAVGAGVSLAGSGSGP
jgi:hypothetical protein